MWVESQNIVPRYWITSEEFENFEEWTEKFYSEFNKNKSAVSQENQHCSEVLK